MSVTALVSKPRLNSAFKQLMSIHWWMATLYVVLFVVGALMAQLPREVGFRNPLYAFHKSIGVLTMALLTWRILTLLRVWWRKYTKRSPKFTPAWFATIALHTSLYGLMWAVPVTGYFLSNSYRSNNVSFFGLPLPDVFPQNSAAASLGHNLHFWFSYTFLAFIVLHTIVQRKAVRANARRLMSFIRRQSHQFGQPSQE